MDSTWHIARNDFAVFDPDREIDDVLARMRSSKVALLLRYWNGLRRGERLPSRDDIDPADIKTALPHVMITAISYRPFRVLYRLVGTEVVNWSRTDFTNRYADELVFESDAIDWTDFYRPVVEARKPAYGISDWIDEKRASQWVETLICPLSSDGNVIDRCIAIEDYEPIDTLDIEELPPVGERRRPE